MLVNLKFIEAFQKDKDGKQKDEGVSFHMKPTGWFRNGLETYSRLESQVFSLEKLCLSLYSLVVSVLVLSP